MILIIGAMPEEVVALTKRMTDITLNTEVCVEGNIGGKQVVVATSGVGKVNAAFTTTSLILKYQPEAVLNIGSAGGLLPNQKVGDVVVARVLQYHDFDIGPTTNTDPRFIFYSDESLSHKLEMLLDQLEVTYHEGLMVSGDQFILKTMDAFKRIQEVFPKAHCVEMEATAIAHVCSKMAVPFVVMRSLSDVVLDNEGMDFETYLPIAAENSARICEAFVNEL